MCTGYSKIHRTIHVLNSVNKEVKILFLLIFMHNSFGLCSDGVTDSYIYHYLGQHYLFLNIIKCIIIDSMIIMICLCYVMISM